MGRHFNLIALGMLLVAAPAAGLAQSTAASGKAAGGAKGERLYCIAYDGATGSRIAKQECRTKAAWKRLGVDVENPDRN